jgi:hypothetical protein
VVRRRTCASSRRRRTRRPSPYGEYQIGGTPIIGDRNEQTVYPLMKALHDGPDGQWWKDSRIFISG